MMGVLDEICLFGVGPITGWLTIIGAVYCEYPTFIFICGSLMAGLSLAEMQMELLLALDRCLYFAYPRLANRIFPERGEKTWFWAVPLALISFYDFLFEREYYFSANIHYWATNPHQGYANEILHLVIYDNF